MKYLFRGGTVVSGQRDLGDRGVGLGLFLGLALLHQLTGQLFVGHGVEGNLLTN